MDGIRLHEDSFPRCGRTCVFTRAAADTILVIHLGNGELAVRHHPYGLRWAMFGTGAAIGLLCFNNAILFYKMRFADLK